MSSAIAAMSMSRVSVQRARGRIPPRIRGSSTARGDAPAEVIAPSPGGCPCSLEPHPYLTDRDLVAEPQRRDGCHRTPVDERAVRAAEILDVPAAAPVGEDGVLGRGERVVDHDRVVHLTAEGGDRVE